MKPLILVTGGAGYMGSHMVRSLLENDYQPVIFDNLSTGHSFLIPDEVELFEGDLQNPKDVERAFNQFQFKAVMHFAASSVVSESVKNPLRYYKNNVSAFLNLLEEMKAHDVQKLILSSTAAVYGEPGESPISEKLLPKPLNPYGQSKWMMEQILEEVSSVGTLSYVVFRYFNAAGAHQSGMIGESHHPETHLIPSLLASLTEQKKITIFGDTYPTFDGTCIRDYVHVEDLCHAHLLALRYLEDGGLSDTFNLGSNQGYSVREVVQAVEKITGREIAKVIGPRRLGDPAELVANSEKARTVLGWKATRSLETIIQTAYNWHEKFVERKVGV